MMRLPLSLLLCSLPLAASSSSFSMPWAFSWDTLATFAFPGDAPRFMTQAEEAHFSNFSMMLIWGMNATCFNASSSSFYEPDCYSSVMYCDKAHPESQPFVRNMEASLQEQGSRLKQARPSSYFPVLGYIEGMSIQQTYKNQMALVDNNSSALLSIQSKGLVDCYTWGGCNWQGVEFRQYDLRQAAVVEYYANAVIGGLIDSPGLDGSFVDVIDFWLDECDRWGCTAQEKSDLTAASLTAVDAALGAAAALGKVLSISSHTSLGNHPDYYQAQLELLIKHGNGFRFWEFFTTTEDDVASLAYETLTKGVPTHVHVTERTLNPDWVELACYLLAMGEYSYFSYSGERREGGRKEEGEAGCLARAAWRPLHSHHLRFCPPVLLPLPPLSPAPPPSGQAPGCWTALTSSQSTASPWAGLWAPPATALCRRQWRPGSCCLGRTWGMGGPLSPPPLAPSQGSWPTWGSRPLLLPAWLQRRPMPL